MGKKRVRGRRDTLKGFDGKTEEKRQLGDLGINGIW